MTKKQLTNVLESVIALAILYGLSVVIPMFIDWIKS